MNFHRDQVRARGQIRHRDVGGVENVRRARSNRNHCLQRQVCIGDRSGRQVGAKSFLTVEPYHGAVHPREAEVEIGEVHVARHDKRVAEIGGDVSVGGIRPITDRGEHRGVAVAQSRRSARPAAVVVIGL
jgi:hypothetical protein